MRDRIDFRDDTRSLDDFAKRIKSGLIAIHPAMSWSDEKRAHFIESIAYMGLPFGQVYVQELPTGRYVVVDGSQRLQAVMAFLESRLLLDGVGYDAHAPYILNRFEAIRIRYHIIPFDASPELVQDILARIK